MTALLQVLRKHSIKLILPLVSLGLIYWIWVSDPKYMGYAPDQPIPFSHQIHAGDLNIDCQFCHTGVEKGPQAGIPDTATCMKCHTEVASDSPNIQFLRQTYAAGQPMHWVKVYDLPDHARFSHQPHIARGFDCTECHGDVANMEKIEVVPAFNMGWCVNCHRENTDQAVPPGNNTTVKLTECGTCHF
ncbi:MAG: cytochrome c3 family protein [Leptospiraceae bacterium]|nr:cytochrome c3 family protein [Leptospiraceae bacterium]MCB1317125.1 cytochrome c3 family protein [Leptospiraceae bacterium]